MKLPFVRALALVTVVMMAVVLVQGSRNDTRQRLAQAEELMAVQGNAIAQIVAESSAHSLEVYANWEAEAQRHLLDNANWLAWVNTQRPLSASDLAKFAADLDLWRVLFFDAQGRLEKSSHPEGEGGQPQLPSEFLAGLTGGLQRENVLGFRTARIDGQTRLVVGVGRPGGGAVVVSSRAALLQKSRVDLGPGHLIKILGEVAGLRYVVVQDRGGILAASTGEVDFALPAFDPTLVPLTTGAEFATRRFDSDQGPVLEVSRILEVRDAAGGAKSVLLRVGLDTTLLNAMEADTRRRARLRILLLAGSLVLMSILLLAWQRQAVLDREVSKVTRELRLREDEALRTGKLAAMGNLAAGVAHEIRNPLNTIHMIAQSLGRSPDLPADITGQAKHIRDESGRIEGIVQQFLDFARPRDPVFEPLELGELVRETVAVQQTAHAGSDLQFQVAVQDCQAELDRHFVIEIVDNLVRNATDALAGKGTVAVSLTSRRGTAEIVVEDSGPGVPPEAREKVFDLYYTTKPSGSGLGLSLVSRMVTAMDGRIILDQEHNTLGGARFLIRLPLQRSRT